MPWSFCDLESFSSKQNGSKVVKAFMVLLLRFFCKSLLEFQLLRNVLKTKSMGRSIGKKILISPSYLDSLSIFFAEKCRKNHLKGLPVTFFGRNCLIQHFSKFLKAVSHSFVKSPPFF